ncbi:hypothetical protein IEO21_09809 [Rhodonia placenta]|uniref:Uncharacterized protein n=1 Tax=Rhodonia placenta TaxID=104341 RepID=A0A8H7NTM7_9APHY|nr:hypothetical protein IEO21_09809 [Postia placenta]
MSQYSLPQLPFMPMGGGPGSVAGSDYGHMSMVAPMPYQQTASMYGMMPNAPRNTIMTNMNMFGGEGDASGSQSGFAPPGGIAAMQRPMSTFSLATSVNPFAGPSMNPDPSDDDLINALRNYLSTQDLMTVTKNHRLFRGFFVYIVSSSVVTGLWTDFSDMNISGLLAA